MWKRWTGQAARNCSRWLPSCSRWPLGALALSGAVVLVLPTQQIRLGASQLQGLIGGYMYEVDLPVDQKVTELRVADIYLPPTMRTEWNYHPMGRAVPQFQVKRTGGGTSASLQTQQLFWNDAFPFQYGTTYTYQVTVAFDESAPSLGLSAPPAGANASDIYYRSYASGQPPVTITAIPMQTIAADAQTADARYDLRYSTYTFLNHNFGTTTYRGGLYAGNSTDPARIGRSYLRFRPAAPAAGQSFWTGSVNAYLTKAVASGSWQVGCQPVADNGWTVPTLTWATAPPLDPLSPLTVVPVTYSTVSPTPAWLHWPMHDATLTSVMGSQPLSAGLAVTSEAADQQGHADSWLYFAKTEYDPVLAPQLIYALSAGPVAPPTQVQSLALPATVKGGTSFTGSVSLNYAVQQDYWVRLSSSGGIVTVPSGVFVKAGTSSASFTATAATVSTNTATGLTATASAGSASATVTVTP